MRKFVSLLALVLFVFVVAPASASHLVGIKVVATDVNAAARSVDVDFTLYTQEEGDRGGGQTVAIDLFWGDGEGTGEAEATLVSSTGPNVYRGSMVHTYEEADVEEAGGDFTIRVRDCCAGTLTGEELVTGRFNEYPTFSEINPPRGTVSETLTNTTMISFNDNLLAVPTANGIGLLLLSAMLGVGGLVLLRR